MFIAGFMQPGKTLEPIGKHNRARLNVLFQESDQSGAFEIRDDRHPGATAHAIGKATFGLDCVQRSHDCDVRLCVYRIRCGGCDTCRYGSKRTTSIKCFAVTMRTTAWPEISGPCGRSIVLWSIT